MTAERVDLPSGAWVALKDPRHVTIRGRRPIVTLMGKMSDLGIEAVDDMLCVGGATLIAQWSFDEPPTADSIADLIDVEDADVLLKKIMPLVTQLAPDLTVDGADNPDSPTGA